MKKPLLLAALLGLVVVPALADIATPIPQGTAMNHMTIDLGSGQTHQRVTTAIYADLATSGYYRNSAGQRVADDIHASMGGIVTGVTFGYYTPNSPSFTATIRLIGNTSTDLIYTPVLGSAVVTGLPGAGAWSIGVVGLNIPVGVDFWFEVAYPAGNVGPLITGNAGGTVGYSHNWFTYNATVGGTPSFYYFGGAPWADFFHAVWIPEPGTLGLLALSGLLLLARRR